MWKSSPHCSISTAPLTGSLKSHWTQTQDLCKVGKPHFALFEESKREGQKKKKIMKEHPRSSISCSQEAGKHAFYPPHWKWMVSGNLVPRLRTLHLTRRKVPIMTLGRDSQSPTLIWEGAKQERLLAFPSVIFINTSVAEYRELPP